MYVEVILGIICLLTFLEEQGVLKKNRKTETLICITILMFFFLRLSLGMDTLGYVRQYTSLYESGYTIDGKCADNSMLALWFLLMKFSYSHAALDYASFQTIISAICMVFVGYTMLKYSDNLLVSLIVFMGSGLLNVYYSSEIRAMLCMAVFFFSFYECFLKKRYILYYVLMIPCLLVHERSVIALLVPLAVPLEKLLRRKKGRILLGFVFALCFCIAWFFTPWLEGFLPIKWAEILAADVGSPVNVFSVLLQIVLFGMVLLLYHYASEEKKSDEKICLQICVCFLAFALYIIFAKFSLMSRVSDFLLIIHMILMPALIGSIPESGKRKLILWCCCVLYMVLCFIDIYSSCSYLHQSFLQYPYVSIFHPEKAYDYYDFHGLTPIHQ